MWQILNLIKIMKMLFKLCTPWTQKLGGGGSINILRNFLCSRSQANYKTWKNMKFVWKNSSQILFQITFAGQICSLKSKPIFELFSKLLKICDFWSRLEKIYEFVVSSLPLVLRASVKLTFASFRWKYCGKPCAAAKSVKPTEMDWKPKESWKWLNIVKIL